MKGILYIIGMGPGDPELITKKAETLLGTISTIAYFSKKNERGHARSIADLYLQTPKTELRFEYPITTEIPHQSQHYKQTLQEFYDQSASAIQEQLDRHTDVALLCEGDPLLYGSAIYILERLQSIYRIITVPGISAMNGCWNAAQMPIVRENETLTIIPATLPLDSLIHQLRNSNACIIMKIGRNFQKVQNALKQAGLFDQALYIEKGTQPQERILPLKALSEQAAPYFSLILIAGHRESS